MTSTRRRVDSSAVSAFLPVVAVIPLWLLALAIVWLPLRVVWHISFVALALGYLAAVLLLFFRPVQVAILAPLLGARRPTRHERATLDIAWRSVLQANRLPARRFVIAVLPIDELNAFACGGHLVVVTSYAIDTLPRDELSGVLAHELSHHLGIAHRGADDRPLAQPAGLRARPDRVLPAERGDRGHAHLCRGDRRR